MKPIIKYIRQVRVAGMLTVLAMSTISQMAIAQNPYGHKDSTVKSRNVFGTDDRKSAVNYTYKDYTNATAVAVEKSSFVGNYLTGKSLGDKLLSQYKRKGAEYVSSEIRFQDEPAFGFCSGFLIAPDILVTAGHCIDYDDYYSMEWIFDFTNDIEYKPGDKIYIPPSKRYNVKKILTRRLTYSDRRDYAVLQLDRPVDRKPFTFRTGETPTKGSKVTLLGAPSGIPLKVVEDAKITSNNSFQAYFRTNLDAFGGNSGGPVFSSTGLIEGILVRGPTKGYYVDESCKCLKTSTYTESYADFIQGVEVQKINDIPWNVLSEALYSNINYAIERKDEDELDRWVDYSWIYKEPTIADKKPLEIVALESGNMKIFKKVMESGGDMNAADGDGKTLMNHIIRKRNDEALKYLIREGYDVNQKDEREETPLFWAINTYNIEQMKALIDYGASVDLKNTWGSTPIHEVAVYGSVDMAKLLVENGANLLAKDADGCLPKQRARKSKNRSVKKYLKQETKKQKKAGK